MQIVGLIIYIDRQLSWDELSFNFDGHFSQAHISTLMCAFFFNLFDGNTSQTRTCVQAMIGIGSQVGNVSVLSIIDT